MALFPDPFKTLLARLTFARLMVCGRCTTICDAACSPFASEAAMSTLVIAG